MPKLVRLFTTIQLFPLGKSLIREMSNGQNALKLQTLLVNYFSHAFLTRVVSLSLVFARSDYFTMISSIGF